MIYHAKNLTHCVVVIPTLPKMRVFLADRQRSVTAKMRRAIKGGGLRAGHPEAECTCRGDDTNPQPTRFAFRGLRLCGVG